jgi:hypothetical protein
LEETRAYRSFFHRNKRSIRLEKVSIFLEIFIICPLRFIGSMVIYVMRVLRCPHSLESSPFYLIPMLLEQLDSGKLYLNLEFFRITLKRALPMSKVAIVTDSTSASQNVC